MEFRAEIQDGVIKVKPIIEKDKKGNVKVHLPSFPLVQKLVKEKEKENNGKRNIQ